MQKINRLILFLFTGVSFVTYAKETYAFHSGDIGHKKQSYIIRYKAPLDEQGRKEIDSLNAKLGAKIVSRLKTMPVDIIIFSKGNDGQICKRYLEMRFVENCERDQSVKPDKKSSAKPSDATCSEQGVQAGPDIKSLSKVVETLQGDCKLLRDDGPKLIDGHLSAFWAQEYIGADLAKLSLSQFSQAKSVTVSLFDVGLDYNLIKTTQDTYRTGVSDASMANGHGTMVASLINGEDVGVSEKAQFLSLHSVEQVSDYLKAIDLIRENKLNPQLINNSMSWDSGKEALRAFRELTNAGSILVTSAGNKGESFVPSDKREFKDLIIVGSLSPIGFQSDFSSSAEEVTISVPSDYKLTAFKRSFQSFGGTSGATPLVTGALANVISVLPDISIDDVKTLLAKTAIPTPNSLESPQENGAGMLNAFKLIEVAKRINLRCEKKLDRKKCIKDLIREKDVYLFEQDDNARKKLISDVAAAFPGCADGQTNSESVSCTEKKQIFSILRQRALLDTEDRFVWSALACIHDKLGLTANAQFYSYIARKDRTDFMAILEKAASFGDAPIALSAIRASKSLGERGLLILSDTMKNSALEVRMATIKAAKKHGTSAFPIIKMGINDQWDDVRKLSAEAAPSLGDQGLDILNIAIKDDFETVRIAAVSTAAYSYGEKARAIFEIALHDESLMVRDVAQNALKLLKKDLSDNEKKKL